MLVSKKPGMPVASVVHEESASATPVKAGNAPHSVERSTRRQNSCEPGEPILDRVAGDDGSH